MERWTSLLGLLVMLLIAWAMSTDRRRINWRLVSAALALQFGFALFILKTGPGHAVFSGLSDVFQAVIAYSQSGTEFMFGLSGDASDPKTPGRLTLLTTVAFGVLPTIVFFSSLMSVLYYLGAMQRITEWIAVIMQKTLGTSGAESLSAAANIFVGQTEAPLVIKPFLKDMTISELHAVMVGGFATIAGGVMAFYVMMGVDAGHLITASVISAPAALLVSKMMQPETEHPVTLGRVRIDYQDPSANVIEAAASGAADGMKLALNVAAMLIAFLSLLSLCDGLLGWLGQQWNTWTGSPSSSTWSMGTLLSYLFAPFAWVMGVPQEDCLRAGELLGIRTAANEFIAYDGLSQWMKQADGQRPHPRTVLILTYAFCGFANLGSIGVQIGGIGAMVPERRADLARLGMRAMIAGTLASFMTACVAGILTP
jgi:CNT family concentrative nucleoside transporter